MSFHVILLFGNILSRAVVGTHDVAIFSQGKDNKKKMKISISAYMYFKHSEFSCTQVSLRFRDKSLKKKLEII